QPGAQPPDPVQLGLVVRPPAGPSPVRHELVQGGQAWQQFLAAAAGVDQGGGTGQRHLGVMGKNHLAPFHRPCVVSPALRTLPLTGAAVPGLGPRAPGAAAGNVGLALAVLTAATSGTAGTFASALIGAGRPAAAHRAAARAGPFAGARPLRGGSGARAGQPQPRAQGPGGPPPSRPAAYHL